MRSPELITILQVHYKVSAGSLIGAMHDRASVNNVAMHTVSIIYPDVLDIGCFSHTMDHVGEKFVTTILDDFVAAWVQMFAHSPKSRLVWQNRVGRTLKSLSNTRWWSRWEVINQLLELFGDVEPFLVENDDLGPHTRLRMLTILQDPTKKTHLMIEMAAVVDAGKEFVKATYNLERDGALVLECYERVQAVFASIHVSHYPNVDAIIQTLTGLSASDAQQWKLYAQTCVKPGWEYFVWKFTTDLCKQVEVFKAARLFMPRKVVQLSPDAATIDSLQVFPFLAPLLPALKSELLTYLALASGISTEVDPLQWWKLNSAASALPNWALAFGDILLIQPSSAATEHVFSLLNNSFNSSQDLALQDYLEASLILQYNRK